MNLEVKIENSILSDYFEFLVPKLSLIYNRSFHINTVENIIKTYNRQKNSRKEILTTGHTFMKSNPK